MQIEKRKSKLEKRMRGNMQEIDPKYLRVAYAERIHELMQKHRFSAEEAEVTAIRELLHGYINYIHPDVMQRFTEAVAETLTEAERQTQTLKSGNRLH